jgi:hypothetical protein
VYDFGGGTFDTALVEVAAYGQLLVLGHHGLPDCGGIDVDRLIFDALAAQLNGPRASATGSGDPAELANRRLLRELRLTEQARSAKHHLSSERGWTSPFRDDVAGTDACLALTRDELEKLALPLIEETVAACDDLLTGHDRTADELTRVVTVGGMSRMPAVSRRLQEHFGRPVVTTTDPELAIAHGAALVAASIRRSAGQPVVDGTAQASTAGWSLPELAPIAAGGAREGQAPDGAPVHAAFLLAELLWESGRGGDARQWYELAAGNGHSRAAYQLGWLLKYAGDMDAAAMWWERAAVRGDVEAGYYLGELLWELDDPERAERWFLLASHGGHGHAAYQLGWLHKLQGDLTGARHFWERAAQAGDGDAVLQLEALLRTG